MSTPQTDQQREYLEYRMQEVSKVLEQRIGELFLQTIEADDDLKERLLIEAKNITDLRKWFRDYNKDKERFTEVLNVMLLHITYLNITAVGLEGKRKEIALEDSKNAMEIAEWFKATYLD